MFKLDNDFLTSMGLGTLPVDEKNRLLQMIYERLEMNVGMRLAEKMTDQQLDEFEGFIDRNDEPGALKWLETNFPNYKDVVAEELEKLKGEVQAAVPQIMAASQVTNMQPQGQQPMVGGQPQMPPMGQTPVMPGTGQMQPPAPQQQFQQPMSSPSAPAPNYSQPMPQQPYNTAPPAPQQPAYGPAPAAQPAQQPPAQQPYNPAPQPNPGFQPMPDPSQPPAGQQPQPGQPNPQQFGPPPPGFTPN